MVVLNYLKNRKKIKALKEEKARLLAQIPADKYSRFQELFELVKNGNACKRSKLELIQIYNLLKEMGCKEVAEKVRKINKKIKVLKNG